MTEIKLTVEIRSSYSSATSHCETLRQARSTIDNLYRPGDATFTAHVKQAGRVIAAYKGHSDPKKGLITIA